MTHIGGDPIGIPDSWTFRDDSVAKGFDDHVRQQLPWYDFATHLVSNIARGYLQEGSRVYDIGAGTGNIANAITDRLGQRKVEIVSIEPAVQMTRNRSIPGRVVNQPVETFAFESCDCVVSFLALVFIHPSDRTAIIRSVLSKLRPGGCFIVVERWQNTNGYLSTVFQRLNYALKAEAASTEDILAKELSIHGIQRPLSRGEIPSGAVEFFRAGDFAGYIVEAPYGKTD